MEKKHKILLAFCIFLASIILVLLAIFARGQAGVTKEVYFVVLLGVAASLLAWSIIHFITSIYSNPNHEYKYKLLHHKLDNMENLVEYKKNDLLGKGFYSDLYEGAEEIRISGVTGRDLFESIIDGCRPRKQHWIHILKQKPVTVKILMIHPESPQAALLDEAEGGNKENPVTKKIYSALESLKTFSADNKKFKLNKKSEVSVRFTDKPLHSTISHVTYRNESCPNTLLMGLLFTYNTTASMYKIPEKLSIYHDCLKEFDKNFNEGCSVFQWNSDGKAFTYNMS